MFPRRSLCLGVGMMLVALAARHSFAQTPSGAAEQQVMKAHDDLVKAELASDVEGMNRLLADGHTHTHTDGRIEIREVFVDGFRRGTRGYDAMDLSDLQVRFYDPTTAVITGHVRLKSKGNPNVVTDSFMEVWVQQQGAWHCAAYSVTRGAAAAKFGGQAGAQP